MKSTFLFFVCALICSPVSAASLEELMQQGDVFDVKHEPDEALKYYLPAEKLAPDNAELLVHIARQYSYRMSDESASREQALKDGETALEYSERAVKIAPDMCDAQLAIAISHGKLLPFLGNKEKIRRSAIIRDAAQRAVELDPKNDVAWHILGRWHQLLADLSGIKRVIAELIYGNVPTASLEESERCLKMAMALNPKRLMHVVELGRTYAKMGRTEEARKYIEKGLAMPVSEPEDAQTKKRGRDTLAAL